VGQRSEVKSIEEGQGSRGGVEFSRGSNEGGTQSMSRLFRRPTESRRRGAAEQAIGALEKVWRQSGRTTSAKSEGGAYSKAVGLGISAVVALIIISLSVWLLRRRASEETTSVTPEPEEGVAANKALMHRVYEEGFSQNNLDVLDELIASDFTDHNPNPGQGPGLEGLKQFISSMHTALPDLQVNVEDMIAEGDKVVARLRISGTHQGEFMGIAPTGNQVTFTGIDILRIADGKVVEHWGNVDELGMLRQLGVIPE
jgi:predicted ester cyclase